MEIKITQQEAQAEYPELYQLIIDKMTKKKVNINNIEWFYSFCVVIDNSPEPTSLQECIDKYKTKYGISLDAYCDKKRNSELIKQAGTYGDIPSFFMNLATNEWNQINSKTTKEQNLVSNLDSILKAVGKKGTAKYTKPSFSVGNGLDFLNHLNDLQKITKPVYPKLEDIKNIRPDIYQNYLNKADGTVLVIYSPQHLENDEWGFRIEPILAATRRNNEDRFITEDWGSHYIIKDNFVVWGGSLGSIDKAFAATEGSDFAGWKKTKQYRLTKDEIKNAVVSKIFKDGGINF